MRRPDPASPNPVGDPVPLTPDQRRREIAAILARGVLRLARLPRTTRSAPGPEAVEHAPQPAQKTLEASADLIPHVTGG